MHFSKLDFTLLAFFTTQVLAQHGHYPQPPWVQSVVSSITSEFAPYVTCSAGTKTGQAGSIPTGGNFSFPGFPKPRPKPSDACSYWLEEINHQGKAPFQSNSDYQVFRNVKDFGAKGDGITDDTAAINAAISSGNRCAPGSCASTTTTPAIVYFPTGTYLISSSIIDYYYTQLIGNPNCLPTLKATANFTGLGLIDGDPYGANGLSYGSTNVFWRQVHNFILDMTGISANVAATGIHWPTAQATSLQNLLFLMSEASGTQHQGVFIEEGSGGFMTDLVFYGGLYGMNVGNQQFTMRNLSFHNANTAINQLWDWGWTYKGISIDNCSVGLNMSSNSPTDQTTASIVFFDSQISNTPVGILTNRTTNALPPAAGSLIIENVQLNNVPIAVQDGPQVVLPGTTGSTTINGWGQGHSYTPNGPVVFEKPIPPNHRPSALLSGNAFYQMSKPQYQQYPVSSFLSARSAGARGDGVSDDTAALQGAILSAAAQNKILFIDAGDYKVTSTIYVPSGSRIVGEAYPVILGSGSFFSNMRSPKPIVQVGHSGEKGTVEWSNAIVSTQGATAGAILIEWNLSSASSGSWSSSSWLDNISEDARRTPRPQGPSGPSGLWDVHTRIGGFAGSNLQLAECPTTPAVSTPPTSIDSSCIAAFMAVHITPSAGDLYMENVWIWTADHDVEDPNLTQITVYAGRGLLIEATAGPLWLYGTAVEHHTLYQYSVSSSSSGIFMGQIQTETPYYQPNPPAPAPFSAPVKGYKDPVFPAICLNATGSQFNYSLATENTTSSSNPCSAPALLVDHSSNVLIYGAGLYSFFSDYSTVCSAATHNDDTCQFSIFNVTRSNGGLSVYNLNTIGSQSMAVVDGVSVASWADNVAGFVETIALFRP